ncbi:protein of unknown function [Nitrospira japonica]|uniref:Uncharacterized protein n=1 Tax=Nitrospira japonica TaxID=1325564 RepID=A0A1W1I922_9BACT|nr:hypothetical protein [Nitrospira japonica]SLM49514.1 protein of unknown function [Nitrospira japonica]
MKDAGWRGSCTLFELHVILYSGSIEAVSRTIDDKNMMKSLLIFASTCCSALLLWSAVAASDLDRSMVIGGHIVPLGPETFGKRSGLIGNTVQPVPDQGAASSSTQVFRDIPSISGSYSIGGQMFLPYVGAGFGNGYATDLDRSLHRLPTISSDQGLHNQFGQSVAPNEFQMGIRIPF